LPSPRHLLVGLCLLVQVMLGIAPQGAVLCVGACYSDGSQGAADDATAERCCCCGSDESGGPCCCCSDNGDAKVRWSDTRGRCTCCAVPLPSSPQRMESRRAIEDQIRLASFGGAVAVVDRVIPPVRPHRWAVARSNDSRLRESSGLNTTRLLL